MMFEVFCRWIMGLHGATEFAGFSIPVRIGSFDSFLLGIFLTLREGGLGYEE